MYSMSIPKFVKYKSSKKGSILFKSCVVDECNGSVKQTMNLKFGVKFVCAECGAVWSNSVTNSFAGPRDKRHCRVAYEDGSCSIDSDVEKRTIQPNELS